MVDNGNDNQMSMEDLDQIIADTPPGTPPPEETPPGASDNNDDGNTGGSSNNDGQDNNTGNAGDNNSDNNPGDGSGNKPNANEAFAAMRVQNKRMSQALAAVLQQHGLDPALANNPEKLIEDAENARLEEEAKKQKVPAELLKRLTQLEQVNMQNEQKRLADAALAGFQAVKTKYNLSAQDISAFAKQLQDAGTNPFEKEMDLELHYKLHNMDKIIDAAKQQAVEEALRNQSNASQHSSKPAKSQGKETSGVDTIDTMAQFDRFLANLK